MNCLFLLETKYHVYLYQSVFNFFNKRSNGNIDSSFKYQISFIAFYGILTKYLENLVEYILFKKIFIFFLAYSYVNNQAPFVFPVCQTFPLFIHM